MAPRAVQCLAAHHLLRRAVLGVQLGDVLERRRRVAAVLVRRDEVHRVDAAARLSEEVVKPTLRRRVAVGVWCAVVGGRRADRVTMLLFI